MPTYHAVSIGQGVSILTPSADGTDGQALVTDGSGGLAFSTVGAASPLTLTASSASEKPLTIVAATSQTANLQEWQDSSGNVLAQVEDNGKIANFGGGISAYNSAGSRAVNLSTSSSYNYLSTLGASLRLQSSYNMAWFDLNLIRCMQIGSSDFTLGWDNTHAGGNFIVIGGSTADTNDAMGSGVKLLAQNAYASATTNVTGQSIYLKPGAGTTTSNDGAIELGNDGSTYNGTIQARVPLYATAGSAADTPVTIKAATSQTANLQEWQDSSSNVMAKVEDDGAIQATYFRTPTHPTGAKRGFRLETCASASANQRNIAGVAGITGDDTTYSPAPGGHSYQGILRFATGHSSTSTVDADIPAFYVDPHGRVCVGDVLSTGESTTKARLSVSALQALGEPEWSGIQTQLECTGGTLTAYDASGGPSVPSGSTIAEYPANSFIAPTLAAANTSVTATDASTVYISGPPTAGTNMTLTNSYALLVGGATDITASASDVVPLTLHAATSQTANLQEWQDSSSNVMARVEDDGTIYAEALTAKIYGSYSEMTSSAPTDACGLSSEWGFGARNSGSGGPGNRENFASIRGGIANNTDRGTITMRVGYQNDAIDQVHLGWLGQLAIGDTPVNGQDINSSARLSVHRSTDTPLGSSGWDDGIMNFQSHAGTFHDRNTAASGTRSTAFHANVFEACTLTADNSGVTTTDAATVFIDGAMIAGTNETITNARALLVNGATEVIDAIKTDESVTAGDTRFWLYDVDNGQLERVTVGAADSGGTGYKVLRIPN